ncbi:MAG: protein kinase [Pseudomonadota bacterium]
MEETRIINPEETYDVVVPSLPEGTLLEGGKFRIERQVGAGGFGITYLATDVFLNRAVVIKECYPEAFCLRFGNDVRVSSPKFEAQYSKTVQMFMLEARSIAKMRHPNIVTVHHVFEENATAYMVLDMIHGRDLADIIDDEDDVLSPDQVREIAVKTLDAIDLVHKNDLLHRDISPDNILLDKWGSPTLIDFGAAREDASKKTNDVSTMLVVKDGYSPHEFYVTGGKQGPSSDLYALGATLYHLISREAPPNSQDRVATMASGDEDPFVPLTGRFPQYEKAFLEAIDRAMSVAPKDRVQSAKEWLTLIEQDSKMVKMVQIPESRSLTKSLSQLIEETNKHVFSELTEPQPEAAKPKQQPANNKSRPEWVEEFNRETLEFAERKKAEERAAAEAARQKELARWAEEQRLAKQQEEEEQRRIAEELRKAAQEEEQKVTSKGLFTWVTKSA